MSAIYCSSCGSKHQLGAKFCSSCGSKLAGFNNMVSSPQPVITRNVTARSNNLNVDEEGIPTSVVIPRRLEYEIEKSNKNKFSVSEVLSVPPSYDKRNDTLPSDYKIPSKEEYLKQSMRECGSSKFTDIDET